jgi:16S rRNA A1518/A1519 N6-dimethyltransferase RsmA/KsgA/DIM1 with predicted DNA glycosylase/AP lyase activity
MLWPPDSPWAPFWTTKPDIARKICKIAGVNEKTLVYDLGCGTGTAICIAAKEFNASCVGIEIDPLRFIIAWLNVKFRWKTDSNITLVRDNFFNIDLSKADIFFIYLIPNALKRLTPKFLKEVKKGALFASYIYPFPVELFKGKLQLIKHNKENRIYLYRMLT